MPQILECQIKLAVFCEVHGCGPGQNQLFWCGYRSLLGIKCFLAVKKEKKSKNEFKILYVLILRIFNSIPKLFPDYLNHIGKSNIGILYLSCNPIHENKNTLSLSKTIYYILIAILILWKSSTNQKHEIVFKMVILWKLLTNILVREVLL